MIEPPDEEYCAIPQRDQHFFVRLFRSMAVLPLVKTSPRPWSTRVVVMISLAALIAGGLSGAFITHKKVIGNLGTIDIVVFGITVLLPLAFFAAHQRYVTFQLLAALFIESASLWTGMTVGIALLSASSRIAGLIYETMIGVSFACAVGVFLMVPFLHWFVHPRLIIGPYCPACRYHLIGVSKHECPECGRGFTLEELGIEEAELKPPA